MENSKKQPECPSESMTDQTTLGPITKVRHWWMELYLDWAFQLAPKNTSHGKRVRDLVAAYDSLK